MKSKMIRSFGTRSLKALWEDGDASRLKQDLVERTRQILTLLHLARRPNEMNIPGLQFHQLKGKRKGIYTVHVNGPWCVTFAWDGDDAIKINLEQYH